MKFALPAFATMLLLTTPAWSEPEPIIDMHLHAMHADDQGPPPVAICAPYGNAKLGTGWPLRDPKISGAEFADAFFRRPTCAHPLWSAKDNDALRDESLRVLERRNIVAVASGPADLVARWRAQSPKRIIPALMFSPKDGPSPDKVREMIRRGDITVIGEMLGQYDGIGPDNPANEPYFALAEELDVPVAIHIGLGPQGAAYMDPSMAKYRAALTSPLALEEVLLRHPRLRLYAMHAGWPKLDDMLAMLYAHPQLYVDVGVIDYVLPRAEFYRYLKVIVEAGFGERVMFGSDQMVWPQAIEAAIGGIEAAPFLSGKQRRDILYNNAARFLRLPASPRASP
jgi:uncharacterized protein